VAGDVPKATTPDGNRGRIPSYGVLVQCESTGKHLYL